jgi:hypothetical protein
LRPELFSRRTPSGSRGDVWVAVYKLPWTAILWWLPPLYALAVSISRLPPDSEPLLPDAQGYFQRAADFDPGRWLGGDPREPLWPLANSIPVHIFGEDPTVLRMSSVVMFACLVLFSQYLAREAVGPRFAIAAGALLASSEWLALQAVSGLREETAALGAVLVCLVAIRLRPGWRGPILLGVLAGLAAMIRWDTLILTLPVVAGAFFQHHVPWRRVAVSAAVFALIVVPFCVGNAEEFGDPLYQSNIHAVFFRNLEFGGQPGYPSKEEIAVNSFAGPSDSWPHYLFRLHSTRWVAKHTISGTLNTGLADWTYTVLGPFQAAPPLDLPTSSMIGQAHTSLPWLLLFATGLGFLLLLTRRTWPIAVVLVLALLQHAPIQHLMDPRLGLAAVPFMAIAVMASLRFLWTSALDAIAARAATVRNESESLAADRASEPEPAGPPANRSGSRRLLSGR